MAIVSGTEQRVNTTTQHVQNNAVTTGLTGGGWVVAWQSYGQDGSDHGVYQQRYDASGAAVGSETLVNVNTYLDQAQPSIVGLANGGWAVIWQSYYQNGSGWSTYQQVYDADGNVAWTESLVGSGADRATAALTNGQWVSAAVDGSYLYTSLSNASSQNLSTSSQYHGSGHYTRETDIATLSDGGWVVTWTNSYGDGLGAGIRQMKFNANGNAASQADVVDTTADGEQTNSAVTGLEDGGWVVVWQSDYPAPSIFMQRYDSAGRVVGGEAVVNTTVTGQRSAPDIVTLSNGYWVVVWQGNGADDSDGIYMRVYNSAGEPLGNEQLVNAVTTGSQTNPAVSALANGSWVITWEGAGDGDSDGVYQRVFERDSVPEGYDLTINVDVTGSTTLTAQNFEREVDLSSFVVITDLPANGTLMLGDQAVVAGQTIDIADISGGKLQWVPPASVAISGPTEISFVILDDGETLSGTETSYTLKLNAAPHVQTPIEHQQATEDGVFSFTIPAGTFEDPEGGALTYSATMHNGNSLPYWLSFNTETGTFSGTPTDSDVGQISIVVTARDSHGQSARSQFELTVENTYDAPRAYVLYSTTYATEDTTSWSYSTQYYHDINSTVTFSISNTDGSTVNWITLTQYSNVNYTVGGSSYNYIILSANPGNDEVGSHALRITVTDDLGGTSSHYHTVIVENVNDAPYLATGIVDQIAPGDADFTYIVPEDTFVDIDVGDSLTYSATLPNGDPLPSWLSFDPETRAFTGTPDNSVVGNISITVTVRDRSGVTASDTFDLAVTPNSRPTLNNQIADQDAVEDTPFSLQIDACTFGDSDLGDSLTYTATLENGEALPEWLSFDPDTQNFSGTPDNAAVGTLSVRVIATDTSGATVSDVFEITVANTNDTPTLANAIADQTATEDSLFSFQFDANVFADIDVGDSLTYTATLENGDALPTWLTFDPDTRTFSGTPDNNAVGTLSVRVIATDTSGATASDIFDIAVANTNDAPTLANAIADQTATEDTLFSFQFDTNVFADIDAGDSLTYTATLENGNALPTWLAFDASTRTFTGTPDNSAVSTLSVRVIATDAAGATVSDLFDLSVTNTNDAPTLANAIADQTATQDSLFSFQFDTNVFADIDVGDSLTYTATLENGDALPTWLTFDADTRTFSGTPDNSAVGTLSVRIVATDTSGATASDIFDIAVANTNDAPTLANAIADQTATEESLFSFQFDTNVFADVDAGDSLTYSARLSDGTSLPSWLAFNASTRTFTGTPGDSDTGTLEVEVTATDRSGASALALFSLDVTNVNDAPVAVGSRIRIDEDTTHSFNASDFGFTDIEGHGLQSIIISSLPGSGRLTLDGAVVTKGQRIDVEDISSLIWKPKAQESGDGYAKISYRVIDDGGTENGGVNRSANAATITFDVSEVVDYFIGGTGNQKLKGTVGTDVLDGGRGRDILTGGKGVDTFIFSTGYGRDTITDFQASGKAHDILDLSGLKSITDFRDLMKNHVQEFDGGVRINGGNGNILVLEDVKLKQLDAGDFLF